jgi:hypothetical protein
MKYADYKYLYPPRPKNAIQSSDLDFWDNGTLVAQPKLNGSNCTIYTNGVKSVVMNRHGQRLANFNLTETEIKPLYRGNGGWMVINGEYLNKNKLDENRKAFNHKLVIFDILVLNGDYLIGSTFESRIKLLDELYGQNDSEKPYLYSISENVYRVKSYTNDFLNIYNDFIKIDVIEGLVMKRKNAKLESGNTENNNIRSQVKCRKATKNYRY